MPKYHTNLKGEVGECSALKSCPFGGENDHFPTKWEAMKHYEETQSSHLFSKPLKKEKRIPLAEIPQIKRLTEKISLNDLKPGEKVELLFKGSKALGNEPNTDTVFFQGYVGTGNDERAVFSNDKEGKYGTWEAYRYNSNPKSTRLGRWVYGSSAESLKLEAVHRLEKVPVYDKTVESLKAAGLKIKNESNGRGGVFQYSNGDKQVVVEGNWPDLGSVEEYSRVVRRGRQNVKLDPEFTTVINLDS